MRGFDMALLKDVLNLNSFKQTVKNSTGLDNQFFLGDLAVRMLQHRLSDNVDFRQSGK